MTNGEKFKAVETEMRAIFEKYNLHGFSVIMNANPEGVHTFLHQIPIELFKDSVKKLNRACEEHLKVDENLLTEAFQLENKLSFVLFAIFVGYYLKNSDFIPLKIKTFFKELMTIVIGDDIAKQIINPKTHPLVNSEIGYVYIEDLSFLSLLEKNLLFLMSKSINIPEIFGKSPKKKKRWESPYKFN